MGKIVLNTERHVRWNYEHCPDDVGPYAHSDMLRYHVVVVDDRDRRGILRRITEQLLVAGSISKVRDLEGTVKNSRLRYLFLSFDSDSSPELIDWDGVRKPVKRDEDLRERVKRGGSIEQYVREIYE